MRLGWTAIRPTIALRTAGPSMYLTGF